MTQMPGRLPTEREEVFIRPKPAPTVRDEQPIQS